MPRPIAWVTSLHPDGGLVAGGYVAPPQDSLEPDKEGRDLVFDPPWNQSMMSEAAQLEAGLM